MPTDVENLKLAYSQITQQLVDMTANPKPSYSVDGRSVSWGEHFNNLQQALKNIREELSSLEVYEIHSTGYS